MEEGVCDYGCESDDHLDQSFAKAEGDDGLTLMNNLIQECVEVKS